MLNSFIDYANTHFPALCSPRAADSHKGTYGSLAVIGGAVGMVGAPLLAARAALKQGTGRVYIGFAQKQIPLAIDPLHAEIMLKTAADVLSLNHLSALVIGCGLGVTPMAKSLLEQCLTRHAQLPLVLDADALNLLSECSIPCSSRDNNRLTGLRVLTPHPTEAARLLQCSTEQVQADRCYAARQLLERYQAWIVLKGNETVIASPTGFLAINPSGNPGLASGGTGDVLAGMIGALLAQSMEPEQAIAGAVWLHGAAADILLEQGIGPIGLTASEVLSAARTLRNAFSYKGGVSNTCLL